MIFKRVVWVGTLVAAWQFLGCSKLSEHSVPAASAMGTVAYQVTHRKVFQFSIIPGGVYSSQELARARRTDPVVALHYADFGVDAHLHRLAQDELVYVSYRKANKVYWTKKKHRVCQGEAVISDAKNNLARARCGNRLSKTPQLPVGKQDPTQSALDTPQNPAGPLQTGAGPLDASDLPPVGPFSVNPNDRSGPGESARSAAPLTTGAGQETPFPPQGFLPAAAPFFSAGPLVGPGLVPVTTGGGAPVTGPSAGGGTTTSGTGGTVTPVTGTSTAVATPEPASLFLLLAAVATLGAWRLICRSWRLLASVGSS